MRMRKAYAEKWTLSRINEIAKSASDFKWNFSSRFFREQCLYFNLYFKHSCPIAIRNWSLFITLLSHDMSRMRHAMHIYKYIYITLTSPVDSLHKGPVTQKWFHLMTHPDHREVITFLFWVVLSKYTCTYTYALYICILLRRHDVISH